MIRQKRPKLKAYVKPKSRFPKRRCYPYLADLRRQRCCLADHPLHICGGVGERWVIEPLHLKTRGSGGYDLNNAVSGCPSLAEETEGKMLQRIAEEKYHVSFQEIADRQTARYREETGETQEEET